MHAVPARTIGGGWGEWGWMGRMGCMTSGRLVLRWRGGRAGTRPSLTKRSQTQHTRKSLATDPRTADRAGAQCSVKFGTLPTICESCARIVGINGSWRRQTDGDVRPPRLELATLDRCKEGKRHHHHRHRGAVVYKRWHRNLGHDMCGGVGERWVAGGSW